jgi:hypothetical protein
MHFIETEAGARRLAVQRQSRRAVTGGRTQRRTRGAPRAGGKARRVIAQLAGEPFGPQFHRAGHGLLHVGVAGQRQRAFARGQRVQRFRDACGRRRQFLRHVQQIEPHGGEYLVVARTAEMHAATRRADARGQALLERSLSVFVGEFDLPLAGLVFRADGGEPVADGREVRVGEQSAGVQHGGVRERGAHVVAHQPLVQRVVVTRRVGEHPLVEIHALVPESAHGSVTCPPAVPPGSAR